MLSVAQRVHAILNAPWSKEAAEAEESAVMEREVGVRMDYPYLFPGEAG
jgi:hypothetical protein